MSFYNDTKIAIIIYFSTVISNNHLICFSSICPAKSLMLVQVFIFSQNSHALFFSIVSIEYQILYI